MGNEFGHPGGCFGCTATCRLLWSRAWAAWRTNGRAPFSMPCARDVPILRFHALLRPSSPLHLPPQSGWTSRARATTGATTTAGGSGAWWTPTTCATSALPLPLPSPPNLLALDARLFIRLWAVRLPAFSLCALPTQCSCAADAVRAHLETRPQPHLTSGPMKVPQRLGRRLPGAGRRHQLHLLPLAVSAPSAGLPCSAANPGAPSCRLWHAAGVCASNHSRLRQGCDLSRD